MNAAMKQPLSTQKTKTTQIVIAHHCQSFRSRTIDFLENSTYEVVHAHSKQELETLAKNKNACLFVLGGLQSDESSCINYDLVKKHGNHSVILVNKEGNHIDTIIGLENGADDVVYDNCCSRELTARIKNVLRSKSRTLQPTDKQAYKAYRFYGLTFCESDNLLYDEQGDVVLLHRNDTSLLKVLLNNPRKLMTRKEIQDEMFGSNFNIPDQSLNTLVFRLRKNLSKLIGGKNPIQTVYGMGYRFALDVEISAE